MKNINRFETKRSKGVTFFGWLFIVSSLMGPLGISPGWQIQTYGIVILIINMFFSAGYLLCGIYIIKLNEIARKAAIFLCIISILSLPLYVKLLLKDADFKGYQEYHYIKTKERIIEQVKPEYQQKALENIEKSREFTQKTLPVIIMFLIVVPFLIIEIIPIYFFTRPKVKAQFKKDNPNRIPLGDLPI